MKQLPLYCPHYVQSVKGFREWLDILGYAPSTVYSLPNAIREFLHYLEREAYFLLEDISAPVIQEYYAYLTTRPNITRGGGLSNVYLNKHQQTIKKFAQYLRQVKKLPIAGITLQGEDPEESSIAVLSVAEIHQLLAATELLPVVRKKAQDPAFYEALQHRDRVMISIFYGCGLRRNEGVYLDTGDINFDRGLLHVRKGKNYTERIIPISRKNLQYLQIYLYDARPFLLKQTKQEAFFISAKGRRMQGQSLLLRLKYLVELTDSPLLQQKRVGLHTLRHSIATHLLAAGMQLERIKDFLGHRSLESTQIYTHLTQKEETYENDDDKIEPETL
ncbi:MAG: tyrosine-type recombinase/integrase [Puia sp.]|nr:tyrosine-type recombinase/integrase [Puia sp.]